VSGRTDQFDELRALIEDAMADRIDPARVERLEALLADDAEARRFYLDYTALHADLRREQGVMDQMAMPIARDVATDVPSQTEMMLRARRATRRRMATAFAASFAMAASLIFGMLVYLQTLWDKPTDPSKMWTAGDRVAELFDATDAVWGGDHASLTAGAELTAGPMRLESGLARIRFYSGATMIVQGPADFELRTARSAHLQRGRITAHVPEQAIGFRIDTDAGRIVDLGTEFGVAGDGPRAQVHVFEGMVEAEALGANGVSGKKIKLMAHEAAELDATRRTVAKAAFDADAFVRKMPLKPFELDLADVVAGGDGRGTGRAHEPVVPRPHPELALELEPELVPQRPPLLVPRRHGQGRIWGDYAYSPVVLSRFIDGVFVPDGSRGPVRIDSAGHTHAFPKTTNGAQDLIRSGGTRDEKHHEANFPPVLDSVDYRADGRSVIGLHANAGVTFDLAAISAAHPDHAPDRFTARVGLIDKGRKGSGKADIWVFVDGRLRHSRKGAVGDGHGVALDIPLPPGAKHLTLVSTDGGNGTSHDWVIYGDPRLHLAPQHTETTR